MPYTYTVAGEASVSAADYVQGADLYGKHTYRSASKEKALWFDAMMGWQCGTLDDAIFGSVDASSSTALDPDPPTDGWMILTVTRSAGGTVYTTEFGASNSASFTVDATVNLANRTIAVQAGYKSLAEVSPNSHPIAGVSIVFSPSPDDLGVTTPQNAPFTFSPVNGVQVSLTAPATDPTGYKFYGWYNGNTRVSINKTLTYTPAANDTLTANYFATAGWQQERIDVAASLDDGFTQPDVEPNSYATTGVDRRTADYHRWNRTTGGVTYTIIRFLCNAPQGATITHATLSVHDFGTNLDDPNCKIYGEDIDNSPNLADGNPLPHNRTATTAYVDFAGINAGMNWQSPEVSAVVQEIVSRPGWVAGNYLSFLIISNAGSTTDYAAASYDYVGTYGVGVLGPKFAADWVESQTTEFSASNEATLTVDAQAVYDGWMSVSNEATFATGGALLAGTEFAAEDTATLDMDSNVVMSTEFSAEDGATFAGRIIGIYAPSQPKPNCTTPQVYEHDRPQYHVGGDE